MLEQLVKESPNDVSTMEPLFRVQAQLKDLTAARATAERHQAGARRICRWAGIWKAPISEAEKKYDDGRGRV